MVQKKIVKKTISNVNALREIVLTVNGNAYRVLDPDPKMSLNEWLRNHLHLKGKLSFSFWLSC